jgi:hypothetical protein
LTTRVFDIPLIHPRSTRVHRAQAAGDPEIMIRMMRIPTAQEAAL